MSALALVLAAVVMIHDALEFSPQALLMTFCNIFLAKHLIAKTVVSKTDMLEHVRLVTNTKASHTVDTVQHVSQSHASSFYHVSVYWLPIV